MDDPTVALSIVLPCYNEAGNLPKIYAVSDIFVLPSENEPWGLIVNEVMCAGIPVNDGRSAVPAISAANPKAPPMSLRET